MTRRHPRAVFLHNSRATNYFSGSSFGAAGAGLYLAVRDAEVTADR